VKVRGSGRGRQNLGALRNQIRTALIDSGVLQGMPAKVSGVARHQRRARGLAEGRRRPQRLLHRAELEDDARRPTWA